MIGAVAGDIIGSVHEFGRTKTKDFPLFVPECALTPELWKITEEFGTRFGLMA